jgi:alpha/beta superfamily hydrolase
MAAANRGRLGRCGARWWRRTLFGVFLGAALSSMATAQERVDLPSRPGVIQPIFLTGARSPWASAVLFPGGSGSVSAVRNNFLIRAAPRFAALGVTVAVIDAPSDHLGGVDTQFRAGEAAATDTAAVAAWLKTRAPVPVWLVGTSRGSVSAANAALRLGPEKIAGVVLTSSVWSGGMDAVPLDKIREPVLIVHNRDDTCGSSSFAGATQAYARFVAASAKAFVAVSGGSLRGDPCGAMSPHGYLGIEEQVISPVVAWIRSH